MIFNCQTVYKYLKNSRKLTETQFSKGSELKSSASSPGGNQVDGLPPVAKYDYWGWFSSFVSKVDIE